MIGHKCVGCGGYATHLYGDVYLCCDCHGGYIISQIVSEATEKLVFQDVIEVLCPVPFVGRSSKPLMETLDRTSLD